MVEPPVSSRDVPLRLVAVETPRPRREAPMSERLNRTHLADLQVRADGRTIVGYAVPFDQETQIREAGRSYTEVFRRGAFTRTIAERGAHRVKLLTEHARDALPIGRAELLREEARGLYVEGRVSATSQGDEVLELVRDGVLDAFSVGFRPVPSGDRWNKTRTLVERTEVALVEISVVGFGAYAGAVITGVRSAPFLPVEQARRRLDLHLRTWS